MPFNEITLVLQKSRHELSLSGPAASEKMKEEGLDGRLYDCQSLNFLEISHTCLTSIDAKIKNLINLTNLVLRGNQLTEIPFELGQLDKLKLLDVSRNKLQILPIDFSNLKQIQTLNFSFNELENIPKLENLEKLSHLDFSNNKINTFPDCRAEKSLVNLSELLLNDNCIDLIPPDISNLSSLKILDLSQNQILNVPGELSDCIKLKEIRLKSNKLNDRRLGKLVDQCHYKQVLEYIRTHCPKARIQDSTGVSKTKVKGKKKKGTTAKEEMA
ncbi:Leucine-rich repeat-containing protein 47 [Nymphon striatum]|nr:Leucine-rich repeat-containing protein 47 [Nymphon striatum]